jgi:hypothetical protein
MPRRGIAYQAGGVEIFMNGSHRCRSMRRYKKDGKDKNGFIGKGTSLDGEIEEFHQGYLSFFVLLPGDEEFPAGAGLLFDSACEKQLPMNIIRSIAIICAPVFLWAVMHMRRHFLTYCG